MPGKTKIEKTPKIEESSESESEESEPEMKGGAMLGRTQRKRKTEIGAEDPSALGRKLGERMRQMHGSGFYNDFAEGFSGGLKSGGLKSGGLKSGGDSGGLKSAGLMSAGLMSAGKRKRAPSERDKIVSRVMKEKGMKLGEASRYVKEQGLYQAKK